MGDTRATWLSRRGHFAAVPAGQRSLSRLRQLLDAGGRLELGVISPADWQGLAKERLSGSQFREQRLRGEDSDAAARSEWQQMLAIA